MATAKNRMQGFQPTKRPEERGEPLEEQDDPLVQLCNEISVHGTRIMRFTQQPFDAHDPNVLATLVRQAFSEMGSTIVPLLHDFAKQTTERIVRAEDWMDDTAPLLPDIEKSGLVKQEAAEWITYLERVDAGLASALEQISDTAVRDELLELRRQTTDRIERVHEIEIDDEEDEEDDDDEPEPAPEPH